MKRKLHRTIFCLGIICFLQQKSEAQITLLNYYANNTSAPIGVFQKIPFREGGFSSLYPIPETNGKEFWTISDRGVNVDAANANPAACHPTYDKMYGFPGYAPKIHRVRIAGDSIEILKTITMKRPNGETATGLLNPTGFGSTALEKASTDTVTDCGSFNSKIAEKDIWGIDSEGIVVDTDGNFWICEEGGPTIWKLNPQGVVLKRFTPYAKLSGAQSQDVLIDTVFKYRKNNRGFEGISITPNGKIYVIIQSPLLYPTTSTGENTQIHRLLEINPVNNSTRMFAYLNEGNVGAAGPDQIRLRDWKIGDMAAVNDHEFLLIEAGARGSSDVKKIFKIDITHATPVNADLYGGKTLEGLKDATGLDTNKIVPVSKTLFLDLLASGWKSSLDKSEGIAIVNDSTVAVGNDNDYGQSCPEADGIALATSVRSHIFIFGLKGSNKLVNYVLPPSFSPEINLTGNNETIKDGDTIPSVEDNTHFGNVSLGNKVIKEFVLQNTGPAKLLVNAISFTGINAAEYSLTGVTPTFPVTIPAGGSLPIYVAFQPLDGGSRVAFLTVSNTDSDESVYDVLLLGEATFATGIKSSTIESVSTMYPNPATDVVTLETTVEKQQRMQVRVFNLQGKEIIPEMKLSTNNTGKHQIEMNVSALNDGVYYVEVVSDGAANRLKMIVMH